MNRITKISITVALAGFLFGFDTVAISGADQQLQALWKTTDFFVNTKETIATSRNDGV